MTKMHDKFLERDGIEVINKLYEKKLAEAWFIGMGWPEGFTYCKNPVYLKETGIKAIMTHNFRAIFHAQFLVK